ncbi:MAG: hypothetical protein EBT82_02425 [Micrococcales bacterium]|nr:hypothetical protein [Micrococcales bacterium]
MVSKPTKKGTNKMKWRKRPHPSELTWVLVADQTNPPEYLWQHGWNTPDINRATRYTKVGARLLAGRLLRVAYGRGRYIPTELPNQNVENNPCQATSDIVE